MTLVTSVLQGGTNSHETSSEEINAVATDFISEGVVGATSNSSGYAPATGGFAVNAQDTPDMTVAVSTGVVYVTATPTSGNSQTLRVKNSATADVTITSNATGGTRYDWVYVKIDPDAAKDPAADASDVATLTTSRSTSAVTDNGTPPTYGYCIAVVTVANGASSISNASIKDTRVNSGVTLTNSSTSGWLTGLTVPDSVTCNGNRSYSLAYSDDLSDTVSPGMRLRTTRSTNAPTQCTSLNGTTQYWSKSSPAGMTFTDDFVVSAWVKLTSYGSTSPIASRYNGTSGWYFFINTSGQVTLGGLNGGSGNNSLVVSYQSVPLNRWVHIAAQLDMSAFTATTTTSYIMLDGVNVPASVSRAGTNPTSLSQAGNLEVGSYNAGSQFFPGKIAQVAIYSAKVTQATIKASISQGLAGTETSLVSAYSFNGVATDLNTSNANDLTASGSATATEADSPFGGQADGTISSTLDYGIIQAVTASTITVQVAEGCTIPTSGGVSALSYSSARAPYGFPASKNKWLVQNLHKTLRSVSFSAVDTWTDSLIALTVPVGKWELSYAGSISLNSSVSGIRNGDTVLATGGVPASTTKRDTPLSQIVYSNAMASAVWIDTLNCADYVDITSASEYRLYADITVASGAETFQIRGDRGAVTVTAVNAYL